MVLTDKQKQALDRAVLEYLCSKPTFTNAAKAFSEAISTPVETCRADEIPVLEKKWTAVVRLQRNILSLEEKIKTIETSKSHSSSANGDLSTAGGLKTTGMYLLKSTADKLLTGHRASVVCVCFHPQFNLLISGSDDASLKLWDFESGDFERTLKGHTGPVLDCAFNDDGSYLASCSSDTTVKLWDFSSQSKNLHGCSRTFIGHDHSVSGVRFLDRSSKLVSCSRDNTIKVWDVHNGYCLTTLLGHDDWVRKLAVHSDTVTLASCGNDHNVMIWKPTTLSSAVCTLSGHDHVVECVEFAGKRREKVNLLNGIDAVHSSTPQKSRNSLDDEPNSSLVVVSGSRDRTIKVWQVDSASCLFTFSGHENWVRAVQIQPQGRYLVSVGEDKSIRTWDLKKRTCLHVIEGAHKHFVTCLAVHPYLAVVATGGVDRNIAVWLQAPYSASSSNSS